ncbi:MAG: PaaI family thioesterase [Pseudomonadota bacterium]
MANPMNDLDARIEFMRKNMADMMKVTPWANEMGFEVTRIEKGHVWGVQPFHEKLIGDPRTRVIHGGVITTLLDNLCGAACGATLKEFRFVATLDLRIDYMRPAESGRDILAEAECYHVTKSVAFCRAWAYHESREKVIATAQGAFAINKPRKTYKKGDQM